MPTKHVCQSFLPSGRCKQCFEFPPTPSEARAAARKEGYRAGVLAGLRAGLERARGLVDVYADPTIVDELLALIAHVEATGKLPEAKDGD